MNKKWLSVFLCLALFASVFSLPASAAKEDMRTSFNEAQLSPLRTGYEPLDRKVDDVLAQITTKTMSTYDKAVAVYDYCVTNFRFNQPLIFDTQELYHKYLSSTDMLTVKYANDLLNSGEGLSNGFSSLFLVLMRAVGLNCYQVKGRIQDDAYVEKDHTLNLLFLNNQWYVFDTQRENDRFVREGAVSYAYFGLLADNVRWFNFYNAQNDIGNFKSFRRIELHPIYSYKTGDEAALLPDEPVRIKVVDGTSNIRVTGTYYYCLQGNYDAPPTGVALPKIESDEFYLEPQGPGEWTVFLMAVTPLAPLVADTMHYRWLDEKDLREIPGDADFDGAVTAADARLALRASVGLELVVEGGMRFLVMDADADDQISAADARLILRASVGLEELAKRA